MAKSDSLMQRLSNRIFAVPTVAQWWAKLAAGRSGAWVDPTAEIPFARWDKPLAGATVALLTTGGIHLPGQPPFDMDDPDGDASYRELPGAVATGTIVITHKYYDHRDADADLNVIFPLEHFRDLVGLGVIGGLAPRHFGFMGHIDGPQVAKLTGTTAPEVAAKLRADGVDFAFLTPA